MQFILRKDCGPSYNERFRNVMSYTIVGVIGHIDHGKTSLVAALTGVDTDTAPEERRRGITIDLGFASFTSGDDQFALIDAPGHQKYIGNLLAGVASLDLGLLVVASDQGVQAQTIEHAEILRSLGVQRILVALSRCDLTDPKQRKQIREEVEFFLTDLGFETLQIVETSTVSGEGVEELREHLKSQRRREARRTHGPFRMPIDRVFSKPGRGTVVAGTLWAGKVCVGDELMIQPSGQRVRVRDIEAHGQQIDSTQAGMRTAMNLAGVDTSQLRRGHELVAPASYTLTQRFLAEVTPYPDSPTIKCPAALHFHTATMHCDGRLLGPHSLAPDKKQKVIVQTTEPIVFSFNQPFLLRRPYPHGSIAAGRILIPLEGINKKTREILDFGNNLSPSDVVVHIIAQVKLRDELSTSELLLPQITSSLTHDQQNLAALLKQVEDAPEIIRIGDQLISASFLKSTKRAILKRLQSQSNAENAWIDEQSLRDQITKRSTHTIVKHAIASLLEDQQIVRSNHLLAIKTDQTSLSKKQTAALAQIIQLLADNRTPPNLAELAKATKQSDEALKSLIRFAVHQGTVIGIGDDLYYATGVISAFCHELIALFNADANRTVAEIRDHLQITRKYAIPLLEHFDREQITCRKGDHRTAGPRLELLIAANAVTQDISQVAPGNSTN